jgi:hypothetical protein
MEPCPKYYYPSVPLRLATIRGADPLVRGRRPHRLSFGRGYAALRGSRFRLPTGAARTANRPLCSA